MNDTIRELKGVDSASQGGETLWQTVAGCALFWAGLLVLCWML